MSPFNYLMQRDDRPRSAPRAFQQDPFEYLLGCRLVGRDGERIGHIIGVYQDDDSGAITWVVAALGPQHQEDVLVPFEELRWLEDHVLQAPYSATQIHEVPRVGREDRLEGEEEEHLYRHYGLWHDPREDDSRDDPATTEELHLPPTRVYEERQPLTEGSTALVHPSYAEEEGDAPYRAPHQPVPEAQEEVRRERGATTAGPALDSPYLSRAERRRAQGLL